MQQVNKNREMNKVDILDDKIKQEDEQVLSVLSFPEIPAVQEEVESKKDLPEKSVESDLPTEDDDKSKITEKLSVGTTASQVSTQALSDEIAEVKEVEKVLSKGLSDIFQQLDPATQHQFKVQGEDTSRAINLLLHKTKVKVKEILNLIVKWLNIIPAVNKFFVEQQAKIKTDKLMAIRRDRDKEN